MSEVVTMKDIRSCGMCSRGTRQFFEMHNLDWLSFLKNGIPCSELEKTGDVMALKVVEVTRGRK